MRELFGFLELLMILFYNPSLFIYLRVGKDVPESRIAELFYLRHPRIIRSEMLYSIYATVKMCPSLELLEFFI